MAIVTTSPARGRASIPSAPEGTYEAMAYKYAEQFRTARRQEKQNELNSKVIQWQRGDISYEELKKYLNGRIDGAKDNSTEKVNLMDTLRQVETQQEKIFELENEQIAADKRTELLNQYKDKGISNDEALDIVLELQKAVDKDSSVYQDLVAEEAEIRGAIEDERTSGSGAAATTNFVSQQQEILLADQAAEEAYRQGQISGMARDQIRAQHSQEYMNLISQNPDAATRGDIQEAMTMNQNAQRLLNLRENGNIADVIDKKGMVTKILTDPQNIGRVVEADPNQGLVVGGYGDVGDNVYKQGMNYYIQGDPNMTPYGTKEDAFQAAYESGQLQFTALAPDPDRGTTPKDPETGEPLRDPETGEELWYPAAQEMVIRSNPANGTFSVVDPQTGEPVMDYASIPQTPEQLQSRALTEEQKAGFTGNYGVNLEELGLTTPEATETPSFDYSRPIGEQFLQRAGLSSTPVQEQPTEQRGGPTAMDMTLGGGTPAAYLGRKAIEGVGNLFSPPRAEAATGPQMGPAGFNQNFASDVQTPDFQTPRFDTPNIQTPQFNLNIPEINVPDFNIKDFGSRIGQTVSNAFERKPAVARSVNQTQSAGIGGKIKDFGQKAWGGFKNFLGL